jgi:uncharacterized protein (TIGR02996 family)
MHSDRPFLEAIREQPDDDLHRLAWADWLEEHGDDDRATFIRAQLFAARLDESDLTLDALEDRADDLLAVHDREWAGRIGELALDWGWSRGCIESATLRADTLLDHGDELFETMPIRNVRLLANEDDLPRLAGCAWLEWIEHLEISTGPLAGISFNAYFRHNAMRTLLDSPRLGRLTSLDLRGQGVEGQPVEAGLLARLRRLDLSGNMHFGDRATRRLAESQAPKLEWLGLNGTNITSLGLQAMLFSKTHPSLHTLHANMGLLFRPGSFNSGRLERELLQTPLAGQLAALILRGVDLSANALETLVLSPLASRLRELSLSGTSLKGEAEVGILATSEALAGLRRLDLGTCDLRDKGARVLASSPYLTSLLHLDLSFNSIGGPGIRALLGSPILDRLRSLDLSGNHVGVPNVTSLSKANRQRPLRDLQLRNANLDAECAAILASSPAFARLRSLDLGSNRLSDEGVVAIGKSPHLARLRSLDLDSNGVDSAGVQALLNSLRLGSLRRLNMRNASLSPNEREQLTARYGVATRL